VELAGEVAFPVNLWIGDDVPIQVVNLREKIDGTYVPNATVTAELRDAASNVLGTVSLKYSLDSRGGYYGVFPAVITGALTERVEYTVVATCLVSKSRLTSTFYRTAAYRGEY
jgi:hypothetical protein